MTLRAVPRRTRVRWSDTTLVIGDKCPFGEHWMLDEDENGFPYCDSCGIRAYEYEDDLLARVRELEEQIEGTKGNNRMIEGLKFRFTTQELRDLLKQRVDYHTQRAATKEAELPKIKDAIEAIKNAPASSVLNSMSQYRSSNAVETLEQDIRAHRQKAATFAGMAKHLPSDEIFILVESDMTRLELLNAIAAEED